MFASKDTLLTRPSGGYTIARSVRLRSSASAYFSRTPSASSRTTWTWTAWVKRGKLGSAQALFSAGTGTAEFRLTFTSSDTIEIYEYTSPSYNWQKITTAVYRDPSAWYQIQLVYDTTNGTAGDRVKLYVNSVQVTSFGTNTNPTSSFSGYVNSAVAHGIGSFSTGSSYLDGYLTEINFIDGQALTPSSFGETDSTTGVWKPKAFSGTYGTNGFELNFSDNSASTAATIGKDYSGNGNNWTPNNISVTAGATYDSMVDSPTVSATSSNYAVLNPLACGSYITLSSANLQATGSATDQAVVSSTMQITTPSYWECTVISKDGGGNFPRFGAISTFPTNFNSTFIASATTGGVAYRGNGDVVKNSNVAVGTYTALAANDVLGFALDPTNQTCAIYLNNVLKVTVTGITAPYFPAVESYTTSGVGVVNFGQRPFTYTPPTGFVALNTYNLPASTITNGAAYMAATLYTGTGASLTVANTVGNASFQPDFVWVKGRSGATDHALYDSVRGTTKDLVSNSTAAETTQATGLTAFGSTGFTVGALAKMNTSSATYVGWQWLAGGTSASNTNGSITSTVSVGATQGFSVVTYTGTGATATVGHGLGVAPSMIIIKNRSVGTDSWPVYHTSIGAAYRLFLNTTGAQVNDPTGFMNSTSPTSTVFTVGSNSSINNSGSALIAYCFAAVAGYSAFGSYTGNASTDGTFVFTNFQPRWVMIKRTDSTSDWYIWDTSRDTYNVMSATLLADTSGAETSATSIDGLSNGFKCRSATVVNASGGTYIYAAFASSPFKNSLAR